MGSSRALARPSLEAWSFLSRRKAAWTGATMSARLLQFVASVARDVLTPSVSLRPMASSPKCLESVARSAASSIAEGWEFARLASRATTIITRKESATQRPGLEEARASSYIFASWARKGQSLPKSQCLARYDPSAKDVRSKKAAWPLFKKAWTFSSFNIAFAWGDAQTTAQRRFQSSLARPTGESWRAFAEESPPVHCPSLARRFALATARATSPRLSPRRRSPAVRAIWYAFVGRWPSGMPSAARGPRGSMALASAPDKKVK
mmetsp:Transcript_24487/g.79118  ORF Transcript_24487/g.79118 Transcript_24487/m.79118 type:complete len:264 (-) Transcript_24487:1497-2288(-)